ncbi:hypothetical protein MA03_07835 [Infirmifilum uzonense]|uniref:Uncharacterized protein n=1 Tax=Infirmifilum uzonense TaxID=1550241 RepID=A0A0F7FIH5_9CREN|nr:hypothetical protein MA03_07835 [Infirmifilum uzonense]
MGWRLAALVAAVLAVLALLLVFPPSRQSGGQHGLQGGGVEAPRQVLVSATVLGQGSLALNGTPVSNSTLLLGPGVVSLEARPASGWRLKQLLVNGSPGVADWLRIRGNTSIAAVFERVKVRVVLVVAGDGLLYVNGSLAVNGTGSKELEAEPGVLLLASLEPWSPFLQARLYVNGTPVERCPSCPPVYAVEVRGDTELRAVFEPRKVVLRVDAKGLAAKLASKSWERVVNGSEVIGATAGEPVNVTSYCPPSPEARPCIVGWAVRVHAPTGVLNSTASANTTITPVYDIELEAIVQKVVGGIPSPIPGGVLYAGREIPAEAVPRHVWLDVRPWTAKVEYLGNGTWLIDEPVGNDLYIAVPPNWSLVTVEAWLVDSYVKPYLDVYVVTSNNPVLRYKGAGTCSSFPSYVRMTLARDGRVLEKPEYWCLGDGYSTVGPDPQARENYLLFRVASAKLKVRVSLQP